MARELGHKVTAIRPALIPLVCKESYGKELQGLSLKNVSFSIDAGGRRKASEFGEMLFTHFGVSGPIVLMLSDKASLWLSQGHEIKASIDLNDESHAAHRDGDASDFGSHRYGRGRFRQGNQSVHDGIQSG